MTECARGSVSPATRRSGGGENEFTEQLAKHLAAAYLAHQMDISFEAAMRGYVEPHGQIGELWKIAARFILECHVHPPDDSSPLANGKPS